MLMELRLSSFYALIFLLLLSSCSPRVTRTVLKQYPNSIEPSNVHLLEGDEQVPASAEILGVVAVTDNGFTTKCRYSEVLQVAKNEVSKMGGNAFVLTEHLEPSFWSNCHQIRGRVLRVQYEDTLSAEEAKVNLYFPSQKSVMPVKKKKSSVDPYELSANIGYGVIMNRTKGLAGAEKAFEDKMSNGIAWDMSFHRFYRKNMGWGFMYSGYHSSVKAIPVYGYPSAANNVMLTYVAPQFSIKGSSGKWVLKMNVGYGYLRYCNRISDGLNEGRIMGNTVGANISIGCDYKLTDSFGFGVDIEMLGGSFGTLNYDNIVPERKLGKDERMGAGRVNLMIGIRYYWGKK